MPFGLIFKQQIDHNFEVYVNDMVVKSHSVAQHVVDLEEVFGEISKYNMGLNLKKCTFEVRGENFAGFHDYTSGIRSQP